MTPDGLITIVALLFTGMCFALACGAFVLGTILFVILILIAMFGMFLLTSDDS